MNRIRRTIFLVDREVQGALMLRMIVYWLFCLLSICLMLICWNAFTGPSRRFIDLTSDLYFRYAPALSATLILLPIVMMDVLRMSNKFVGPVMRLRNGLRDLAEGRPAQPLNFRDDDFWREMATDFNRAAAHVARAAADRSVATEEMTAPIAEAKA
jgi:hypothetical protein